MRVTSDNPWIAVLRIALAAGLLSGCSCGDRNIVERDSSGDEPDLQAEAEALCTKITDWQIRCLDENEHPNELSDGERHAACMESWLPAALRDVCHDEAVFAAKCEFTQSCANFPYTSESPRPCQDAKLPHTQCKRYPQYWKANDCDVSKCPGECCPGAD